MPNVNKISISDQHGYRLEVEFESEAHFNTTLISIGTMLNAGKPFSSIVRDLSTTLIDHPDLTMEIRPIDADA